MQGNVYLSVIKPIVTEKTMSVQAPQRKYSFVVLPNANKIVIKKVIEELYSTKVESVNISPVRKKVRSIGRTKWYTKRQAYKKAIVTLKKGEKIDVMKIYQKNT